MAGGGGLERDVGGVEVADLADQNDVRVVAQEAAQRAGETDLAAVDGDVAAIGVEQRGATKPRYVASGVNSTLRAANLELSNVDLTGQFSDLILIQRGYQASSQVLSTASEMIQSLYDLKGRR